MTDFDPMVEAKSAKAFAMYVTDVPAWAMVVKLANIVERVAAEVPCPECQDGRVYDPFGCACGVDCRLSQGFLGAPGVVGERVYISCDSCGCGFRAKVVTCPACGGSKRKYPVKDD